MNNPTRRIVSFAVLFGLLALTIYYLAAVVRGPELEYISWNPIHAVVVTLLALAAGAAWGSRQSLEGWKTMDVILTSNLALVFGLLFLGWGFVWNFAKPLEAILPGARDLLYGFWFIAGILAPYIIRKPGAALAAEMLAALAELLAGGAWGLTLLLSGLIQGGLAEIVFAATGYRKFDLKILMLAGAAAGAGSMVVDYLFWYSSLSLGVLSMMLLARLISGALLAGWLAKTIGDGLLKAGVLDSFAIAHEQ